MKNYRPGLMLFVLFVVFFSSCKKDISEENGLLAGTGTTNHLLGDSNYVDKIFMIESSSGSIDSSYFVFNYDQQKRLNTVALKEHINSADTIIFAKFFYNGNDTLPYYVHDNADSSEYYFYYDVSGKLIRDSVIIPNSGSGGTDYIQVINFTYASNNAILAGSNSTTGASNLMPAFRDSLTLDSRGNVIQENLYERDFSSGLYYVSDKAYSNFDNNISPYLKVPAFKIFIIGFNIPFLGLDNIFTTNNLVQYRHDEYVTTGTVTTLNSSMQEVYTNSYYSSGFLKQAISVHLTPGNEDLDWTYFYKSL